MKQITTDDMDVYGAVEVLVTYPDGSSEWKLERADEVHRHPEKFSDWRHTSDWQPPNAVESYTVDDFAYALAQLTDDCEPMWIKQVTGLSDDECFKIFQIAHAAQQRTWG